MVPVLDDVENFFYKIKICRIVLTIKSLSSINVLLMIWPYSKSCQFYAVVGCADKDPHSIDKLSNLAESRRYLRNALPPYRAVFRRGDDDGALYADHLAPAKQLMANLQETLACQRSCM